MNNMKQISKFKVYDQKGINIVILKYLISASALVILKFYVPNYQ